MSIYINLLRREPSANTHPTILKPAVTTEKNPYRSNMDFQGFSFVSAEYMTEFSCLKCRESILGMPQYLI